MKKVLSLIIGLMIILINVVSYADEEATPNVDLQLTKEVTVQQDAEKVEIVLSIGELTNDASEIVSAGFEATLEYNEEVFTNLEIEEKNGWEINNINKMVGEIKGEDLVANTEIAVLTFTLAENLEPCTETITLKDIEFSDGTDADETRTPFTISSKIVIEEKTPETQEQEPDPTPTPSTTPTTQAPTGATTQEKQNEQSTLQAKASDTTKATSNLPKTGVRTFIIAIGAMVLIGIISFVGYKRIQIK